MRRSDCSTRSASRVSCPRCRRERRHADSHPRHSPNALDHPARSGKPARRVRTRSRDLLRRPLELLVGRRRSALERKIARQLDHDRRPPYSSRTLTVTVAESDTSAAGSRAADRALPREPLLGVVGCPDVEQRKRVDGASRRHREVRRATSARPDPTRSGCAQLPGRRGGGLRVWLAVCSRRPPRARGTARAGRLAHQIRSLVVERRYRKTGRSRAPKCSVGSTDAALAESHKLLAFGERPHSHGPILEEQSACSS